MLPKAATNWPTRSGELRAGSPSDALWPSVPSSNRNIPTTLRHFAISLRELFTQVLQSLAPDAQLRAWTKDPDDYHNGNPTRKARLRYITRDFHDVFGGFFNADVEATVLEFVNSFQKGTHAPRSELHVNDVLLLKARMEGLLRLLLVATPITCSGSPSKPLRGVVHKISGEPLALRSQEAQ